ncbi:lectin [Mycobacteroides abscessus]|uniref:lectin n=1 Tax=Mycobacteroides abscessus TaxID=36809 RepID=UPI0027E2BC32|nr:lectin [Mycobacteroides abscessus]
MADTLTQGQKLDSGQSLTSNNGAYTLTLQDDGNLVLTEGGSPVWASDTSGHSAGRAEVQSDGNFVVYDNGGGALWSSNTEGRTDVKLVLQIANHYRTVPTDPLFEAMDPLLPPSPTLGHPISDPVDRRWCRPERGTPDYRTSAVQQPATNKLVPTGNPARAPKPPPTWSG